MHDSGIAHVAAAESRSGTDCSAEATTHWRPTSGRQLAGIGVPALARHLASVTHEPLSSSNWFLQMEQRATPAPKRQLKQLVTAEGHLHGDRSAELTFSVQLYACPGRLLVVVEAAVVRLVAVVRGKAADVVDLVAAVERLVAVVGRDAVDDHVVVAAAVGSNAKDSVPLRNFPGPLWTDGRM